MRQRYPDPFGPPWSFSWFRMLMSWEGGIFQMFWIEWFMATFLCSCIILILYLTLRNNYDKYELSPLLERIYDGITFVARRFQAAIALMLGFYSIQNMARWNDVRERHGAVMSTINDVALRIAWDLELLSEEEEDDSKDEATDITNNDGRSRDQVILKSTIGDAGMMSGGPPDETIKQEKRPQVEPTHLEPNDDAFPVDTEKEDISIDVMKIRLMRWLNLSHAIVVGNIYETRCNAFSSLEKIKECGLATETEYQFLVEKKAESGFYHVIPLYWFVELLKDAKKQKLMFGVTDGLIGTLTGQIVTISTGLTDLHRIRNQPLPLCYRQLTNLTVRLYVIILMLAAAMSDIENEDNRGRLVPASFCIVVIFSFEYLLFVGWLTVADAIGNPFRSWADEYEWINYVKATNHSSLFLANGFNCNTQTVRDLKGRSPVLSDVMKDWHDVCYVRADDSRTRETGSTRTIQNNCCNYNHQQGFCEKATGFSPPSSTPPIIRCRCRSKKQ